MRFLIAQGPRSRSRAWRCTRVSRAVIAILFAAALSIGLGVYFATRLEPNFSRTAIYPWTRYAVPRVWRLRGVPEVLLWGESAAFHVHEQDLPGQFGTLIYELRATQSPETTAGNSTPRLTVVTWYEFGWPFAILGWPDPGATGGTKTARHGLLQDCVSRLGWRYGIPLDESGYARIPLLVRWDGLIANTGLCSLPIWIIWQVAVSLRNRHRKHEERCISCGYAVRHLPICPECGVRTDRS